ncbi:MAG TPA: N-acetyl-alpha-D-glucosaminyl L-malate synthase BshA, partial [Chitinophagales bacterium]|nr:N-acetyl-alpha-D-glucosaminyl L-malate synthase BshA [Chitinophagales bacterium]
VNITGKTGFVLPVGDVDGMVEKCLYLLQNEEILEQFRRNAYQNALQFKIENIVPMYEDFYNEIKLKGCLQ